MGTLCVLTKNKVCPKDTLSFFWAGAVGVAAAFCAVVYLPPGSVLSRVITQQPVSSWKLQRCQWGGAWRFWQRPRWRGAGDSEESSTAYDFSKHSWIFLSGNVCTVVSLFPDRVPQLEILKSFSKILVLLRGVSSIRIFASDHYIQT